MNLGILLALFAMILLAFFVWLTIDLIDAPTAIENKEGKVIGFVYPETVWQKIKKWFKRIKK